MKTYAGIILSPMKIKLVSGKIAEINVEYMTPEAYWCLLVFKSTGDNCLFSVDENHDKPKAIPNVLLENFAMPNEALEDMKHIVEKHNKLARNSEHIKRLSERLQKAGDEERKVIEEDMKFLLLESYLVKTNIVTIVNYWK